MTSSFLGTEQQLLEKCPFSCLYIAAFHLNLSVLTYCIHVLATCFGDLFTLSKINLGVLLNFLLRLGLCEHFSISILMVSDNVQLKHKYDHLMHCIRVLHLQSHLNTNIYAAP